MNVVHEVSSCVQLFYGEQAARRTSHSHFLTDTMDAHTDGDKGKERATEVLDVEDEEQRHERIRAYYSVPL